MFQQMLHNPIPSRQLSCKYGKLVSFQDADLRENPNGEDDYPWGGVFEHHRQHEGWDPRQWENPTGPVVSQSHPEAVGGLSHSRQLQHLKGIHTPLGPSPLGGAKKHKNIYHEAKEDHTQAQDGETLRSPFYKVDDSRKMQRLWKKCLNIECGVKTFMANHFDRHYYGKCDLTYVSRKATGHPSFSLLVWLFFHRANLNVSF